MEAVKEVLLDESVLFTEEGCGNLCISPDLEVLLRRLRYSNLRVGICYQDDATSQKETIIKGLAATHSMNSISLSGKHEDSFNKFSQAWNGTGQVSWYITSKEYELFFSQLKSRGWRIVYVGAESDICAKDGFSNISKLEELPITICSFNKMATCDKLMLMIGYVMKLTREEDFSKRGIFPMYPTQNGLIFVPLTFELPLAPQLKQLDALLHKATDEIIQIDASSDFSKGTVFSRAFCELKRNIEDMPDFCVIDPLNNIYPLLDRQMIQKIICKLDGLTINGQFKIRAPRFLKVDTFEISSLKGGLSEASLSFPIIVKPQVACGVSDAHDMALVFKIEDFENLFVPLPAVIQEYVDHGAWLFKFYVLGDKVFHSVKKSMPNSSLLASISGNSGSSPIIFNSLKSLPIAKEDTACDFAKANNYSIDLELVHLAAKYLRKSLGLTIFGFDVVIQEESGDHVIVDLNYLPSFKEIPDDVAIPAFWDAIRSSYDSWKANKPSAS